MTRLRWLATRGLHALGLTGTAGIALVVCAAAVYGFGILPARENLVRLSDRLAALEVQSAARVAQPVRATADERIGAFFAAFPAPPSIADHLAAIYATAAGMAIPLQRGEYKFVPAKDGGLAHYEINLPVAASYAQIRRFVTRVLYDTPSMALEDVRFERAAAGDPLVRGEIRFTLFVRES